jgi:hypothetical protein
MDRAVVEQAIGKAKALVASLEAYDGTATQQLAILKEVDAVRATMEQPYDTAMRWVEGMTPFASLNILNRVGLFAHFPDAAGATVSASELAAACRCDVSIITRVIRLAIYNGVFVETAPDVYAHNDLSRAFGPAGLGGFFGVGSDLMKAWLCLPEYVQAHQPEDLYDVRKTPAAFAEGHEGKTYYEIQALNPERRLLWNLTLQSMEKNFPILGMFPFRDLVPAAKDQQDDRPVLVDVGGGRGQALLKIREDCGDAFDGKMILQDLPVVVDSLRTEELPGIQPMKYDIFTPQPIKSKTLSILSSARLSDLVLFFSLQQRNCKKG